MKSLRATFLVFLLWHALPLSIATEETVTLRFPEQRSLGVLYRVNIDGHTMVKTDTTIPAKGTVKIPKGWTLLLVPSYNGCKHLNLLSQLGANNICAINASHLDSFDDQAMLQTCELRSVKYLWVDSTEVTDAGMAYIANMPQLISFSMQEGMISAQGLAHFDALKKLERLRLDYTTLDAQAMKTISSLEKLTYLSLTHCRLDDQSFAPVNRLKHLRTLQINNNHMLRDKGLAAIAKLPIICLDIARTAVTPASSAMLATMPIRELTCDSSLAAALQERRMMPFCRIEILKTPRIPTEVFNPLK